MGNSLSLVLTIEEAFDLEISEDEAEKIASVGDLYDLVERKFAAKWPRAENAACVTMLAFYRVRRALVETGLQRRDTRPETVLETLLPLENRRAMWRDLSPELRAFLPALERSPGLKSGVDLIFWCLIVSAPLSSLFFGFAFDPALKLGIFWFWIWLVGCFGAWWLMLFATRHHAIHLPENTLQIGDLARQIAATRYVSFVEKRGVYTKDELWSPLQWSVARAAGVAISRVTPGARFTEDLDFYD